jgi:hypothetical protein
MYVGVASFLAMIIALWGWSLYLNFSFFNWNKGTDYSLVNSNLKNWDALFNKSEREQQLEQTKQNLRAAFQNLANMQTTATSTPTTTDNTKNIFMTKIASTSTTN